jgi:hypothetical protein
MADASEHKAVLTGDIIGSSRLTSPRRKLLYESFAFLSNALQERYPREIPYSISNFRGDSWQIVCSQPRKALEVGLFIRTYLRFTFKSEKLDTRLAIGIGRISFIPPENISAGDGEAFTLSGHLLDAMESGCMAIALPEGSDPVVSTALASLVSLLDYLPTSWSASQAQAVFWSLHGYKQEEIAGHWQPAPITQASVSAILKRAGWSLVKKSLSAFEILMAALEEDS